MRVCVAGWSLQTKVGPQLGWAGRACAASRMSVGRFLFDQRDEDDGGGDADKVEVEVEVGVRKLGTVEARQGLRVRPTVAR